ncbi:U32 family peptidase [Chloroflexi bacterium TSY]|nr:U32 family peptidase [Chloroflexi bacterium TSY]
MRKPELLAPAKNLERLKVAIAYGADAVYVGGQRYGLRARADNLTDYELEKAVDYAHARNAKVYVTLNAFLHDSDFDGLSDYSRFLETIGVDAVIVSDLGVLRVVQRNSDLDIHLSTQASCLNSAAARLWKAQGVRRLIVGRELSIAEGGDLQERAQIDVEMFVHGAMCMSYSGHCTISNFTAGRDSNRGGCIQSCRLPYQLQEIDQSQVLPQRSQPITLEPIDPKHNKLTYPFMSSKDLWGIDQIESLFQHRICSLKIEGRMKSSLYVATVCKVYRQLIDAVATHTLDRELVARSAIELETMPHRDYFSGSLETMAGPDSVFSQMTGVNSGRYEYLGIVVDSTEEHLIIRLSRSIAIGDDLELLPFKDRFIRHRVHQLFSICGESLQSMHQDSVVCLPRKNELGDLPKLTVIRVANS